MTQPTAPTDTYIITLNNTGGGSTLVTVVVSKGSVQIDSILIEYDSNAPQILDNSINNITQTSAQLNIKLNKTGTGAYILKPTSQPAPSLADVQNGVSFNLTANQAVTHALSGLTAGTGYTLYFIAKDSAGNWQTSITSVNFTTAAAVPMPPVTTLTLAQGTYFHTASAAVTSDKAGTGFYILRESTQTPPSVSDVFASATTVSLINGSSTINFTDLKYSTAYTLYVVATDGTTPQTVVSSTSLTTANLPTGYVDFNGLIWRPIDSNTLTWNDANTACTTQTINGQTGWRLPSKQELLDLFNSGRMIGQGWALGSAWSSDAGGPGKHWSFSLSGGFGSAYSDMANRVVSCVR